MRRCLFLLLLPILASDIAWTVQFAAASPTEAVVPGATNTDAVLQAQVARLIEQLGDDRFVTRRSAERELLAIGHDAFDQLKAAESHPDLEIAARARHVVRRLTVEWVRPSDPSAVCDLMADYGELNEQERVSVVQQLKTQNDEAIFPALCRIARFDQSILISRLAALAIAESTPEDAKRAAKRREIIRNELGRSRRTAAAWLRTYLVQSGDPETALQEWSVHTQKQRAVGGNTRYRQQILLGLLRQQANLLDDLGRPSESLDVWLEMLAVDGNNAHGLLNELVTNLLQAKQWEAVDRVLNEHGQTFVRHPALLYRVAEAHLEEGRTEKAEETAKQAFSLKVDSQLRLQTGRNLAIQGRFDWAEREYRELIENSPTASLEAVYARTWLAAQLHDHDRHLDAAALYDDLIATVEKDKVVRKMLERLESDFSQFQARRDYYRACHAKKQGDRKAQRGHLDRAIEHDPTDIDVLISLYNLPDIDHDDRQKNRKRIAAAASLLEQQIQDDPDAAVNYNNWAWLIANTEGDFEAAVRRAHRAIELADSDSLAGYLDTLARCYYANDDIKNAIKYQKQAFERDPHTKQLKRQLELFEKSQVPTNKSQTNLKSKRTTPDHSHGLISGF